MLIEGTIPVVAVRLEVATHDPIEAVRQFHAAHPAARVDSLDGQPVRGICPCGRPVLERDSDYGYDGETDIYYCPACWRGALEKGATR